MLQLIKTLRKYLYLSSIILPSSSGNSINKLQPASGKSTRYLLAPTLLWSRSLVTLKQGADSLPTKTKKKLIGLNFLILYLRWKQRNYLTIPNSHGTTFLGDIFVNVNDTFSSIVWLKGMFSAKNFKPAISKSFPFHICACSHRLIHSNHIENLNSLKTRAALTSTIN